MERNLVKCIAVEIEKKNSIVICLCVHFVVCVLEGGVLYEMVMDVLFKV